MDTATDTTGLLDRGYAWTADRIATAAAGDLGAPTPCRLWNLRELLDHTIASLTMFTDALTTAPASPGAGPAVRPLGPTPWDRAIAELAARSSLAWKAPGVMERTFELPVGTMPAPVMASANLLELVVHGWDISQASGEKAAIPDALALPVVDFARGALGGDRGDHFAADLGIGVGDTPSGRLVAFLGRTPR
jgi:uncharacterized protein (TIGR03086 family)